MDSSPIPCSSHLMGDIEVEVGGICIFAAVGSVGLPAFCSSNVDLFIRDLACLCNTVPLQQPADHCSLLVHQLSVKESIPSLVCWN
jgi:hypothetical protein